MRRIVILAGRESQSHLHLRLPVLVLSTTRFAILLNSDELEALDNAVEARTEGAVVAVLGKPVVLVLDSH